MAIKITEDGNVMYENEPSVERELLPNITDGEQYAKEAEEALERIEEIAESIPEDYTQLSEDVEELQNNYTPLSEDVAELKNDLNQFPNGTYPNMSVGNADQLTATVGIEDNAPYLFRTSGGSNDIGDREDVKKIVGGTIANNQLITTPSDGTTVVNGITKTIYNGGTAVKISGTATETNYNLISISVPVISGHKYIFINNYVGTPMNGTVWQIYAVGGVPTTYAVTTNILQATSDDACNIRMAVYNNAEVDITMDFPQVTDLTKDFGTAIADYVYSLETATVGAGVAWLKKHFPAQFNSGYQAYDAGSLQSVSGLTMHKMTGLNQWDEVVEVGSINATDGSYGSQDNCIRSKNFCKMLPNTEYYVGCSKTDGGSANKYYLGIAFYDVNKNFISGVYNNRNVVTSPTNTAYFKIFTNSSTVVYGNTYNHDICINLHWDGEKDGTYEPYKEYTYALDDSITIRGIPKVDASGNLYYDGDEYLPDGTVNRRYGVVDLGTLTWSYNSAYGFYCSIPSYIKPTPNSDIANARCAKYVATTAGNVASGNTNKSFAIGTAYVYVSDDAYTDAVTFKTAMSGVYLEYELNTPTTETALPYQETQIVDDFGTEEFILADGAFPVPVGHETYYQNNLRAKLEMSPDSPDGDGLYVVQQESGENTYVPLASTATIQDILTRLTALENA